MYLLDTNVVSELRKPRPAPVVLDWLNANEDAGLYISAVSVGEIQAGIERARRQDPIRAAELERWLNLDILAGFEVVDMDARAFRQWARVMQGRSITLMLDVMIAAIASVNQLVVVTRNVRDFDQLGVTVMNPFED